MAVVVAIAGMDTEVLHCLRTAVARDEGEHTAKL